MNAMNHDTEGELISRFQSDAPTAEQQNEAMADALAELKASESCIVLTSHQDKDGSEIVLVHHVGTVQQVTDLCFALQKYAPSLARLIVSALLVARMRNRSEF